MKSTLTIAAVVALGVPMTAVADMRKAEFTAQLSRLDDELDVARARCDGFGGNAKDICLAEAKGNYAVAKAELEERRVPSARNRYKVLLARAEANYEVATEECDEGTSAGKDDCVAEAKATLARDKADARQRRRSR